MHVSTVSATGNYVLHSIHAGNADAEGSADEDWTALWAALNQRLRDNGFAGLATAPQVADPAAMASAEHISLQQQQQQQQHQSSPTTEAIYSALDCVLAQYAQRTQLVQELLAATDMAREREARIDDVIKHLRRCVPSPQNPCCIPSRLCM